MSISKVTAIASLLLAICLAPMAEAQSTSWDAQQVALQRAELEALLARYELTAEATAYSVELRAQAQREAEAIRSRLRAGDFQTGDQVTLVIEGEDSLSNLYVVQPGPLLSLPLIGSIPLNGVLRSELEAHLQKELAKFIRNPVVTARSSIRVLVSGGIGKPGYLVIPTNVVFSDILGMAGGPSGDALVEAIRVERGGRPLWAGRTLQQVIIEGRTVDQIGLRAGDHIIVPQKGDLATDRTMRYLPMLMAPLIGYLTQLLF